MSKHKYPRRSPEIGKVAARLLTIPVLALALLAAYVLLRLAHDDLVLMADAAPALASGPLQDRIVVPAERRVSTASGSAADEARLQAHDALDPVGAGRDATP